MLTRINAKYYEALTMKTISIIGAVCTHELRTKVRAKTLLLLLPLLQLLVITALLSCWYYVNNEQRAQTHWQAEVQRQWEAQPDRHPHRVAHYGTYSFRALTPLSFLDSGVSDAVGNLLFLEAHRQNAVQFSEAQAGGLGGSFVKLTPASLLLVVWPLLLIAVAFDTVSSERHSGRLRQFISSGLSLSHWLLGKTLAYALLSLIFLLPLFVTALALAALAQTEFTADIVSRLSLLFALYFLYSLVWIGLIVGLSSLQSHSQIVLAMLLGIWLLFVLVLPRFLTSHSLLAYDYPSRAQFEIQLIEATKALGDSHNPNDPHFNAFKAKVLAEYGVSRVEDLPVNYAGIVMAEGERLSAEVYAQHYRDLVAQFEKQDALLNKFSVVNPYLLVRALSMQLTASDSRHFYHFEQASEDYRYQMIQKLNHLHAHHISYTNNKTQRLSAEHWQDFSSFYYQIPGLDWSMAKLGNYWLSIAFWVLAPLLLLIFCSKRIRIYATT